MAPSPENDNSSKAQDKNDKAKGNNEGTREKNKDLKTLSNLNDCELKDLLDEAITYKNPKDREGKSSLFKELLIQAEESERNARAASAGGSEQVRYCNTSAKRSKHRRKPNSISENVMHGGSLDNLAKEELFEVAHQLNRSKRTVSARQREGGSLPSNVNAGSLADPHFFEEARHRRMIRVGGPPEPMDVDMETVSLLEHDSVAENYDRGPPTNAEHHHHADNSSSVSAAQNSTTPKYTTNATILVNVDDPLHLNELENVDKKYEKEQLSAKVSQTNYSVFIPNYHTLNEATKKVDENGNALHQNSSTKGKKKKVQADKNVVSCVAAEKLEGHRSDIINDVKKLLEYIGEDNGGKVGGAPNRTNSHHHHNRSKQLHKHVSEEGPRSSGGGGNSGKKRAQSTKSKENRNELKKSNSLSEISTTKLDQFAYDDDVDDDDEPNENNEVFLRSKKDSATVIDGKLRRSWGDVERPNFYKNPSMENIETASSSDFRVVTKKKKTKKRRSSVSGSRRKSSNVASANYRNNETSKSDGDNRASSPNPRRKSACSVPHSERSNDSSDVDSVHSLPIDKHGAPTDAPISYADIARTSERKPTTHQKSELLNNSPEVVKKSPNNPSLDVSPNISSTTSEVNSSKSPSSAAATVATVIQAEKTTTTAFITSPPKAQPPDVHNIKSFPAIHSSNSSKQSERFNSSAPSGRSERTPSKNVTKQQHQQQQGNKTQCNLNKISRTPPQNEEYSVNQGSDDNMENVQQQQFNVSIPDVQTIEKIHFMNQPGGVMPAHLQRHVVPPQHIHMQLRQHQMVAPPASELYNNGGRTPPSYTAVITHTPHVANSAAYLSPEQQQQRISSNNCDVVASENNEISENLTRNHNQIEQYSSTISTASAMASGEDNDEAMVKVESGCSSVSSATSTNCDNYNRTTTTNTCLAQAQVSGVGGIVDDPSKPPPVVILSGGLSNSNKEVPPGLVFGFDVNEQLLSEDICENFVQRFIIPENYSAVSHNHEKIVNYVGLAWEDVRKNYSMGKAHYYDMLQ